MVPDAFIGERARAAPRSRRRPVPLRARRAHETLERIAPALGERVVVQIESELYAASEQRLLELDEGVESVLRIGDNPSVERRALDSAGGGERLDARPAQVPDRGARNARLRRILARASAAEREARGLRHSKAAGEALSGCPPATGHANGPRRRRRGPFRSRLGGAFTRAAAGPAAPWSARSRHLRR